MTVKPVSITTPLVEGINTAEELIVYVARASSPKNQLNTETAPKLLRWMISQPHWSPFDLVDVTFEVVTSRYISRQMLRHRSFCFQEFSQRYAQVHDVQPIEIRAGGSTNRQSSTRVFDPVLPDGRLASDVAKASFCESLKCYNDLIEAGVAKEVARAVLPECAETRVYMKGSVRSWIHYFSARIEKHAQKEHALVAIAIAESFKEYFPIVAEAIRLDVNIDKYKESLLN